MPGFAVAYLEEDQDGGWAARHHPWTAALRAAFLARRIRSVQVVSEPVRSVDELATQTGPLVLLLPPGHRGLAFALRQALRERGCPASIWWVNGRWGQAAGKWFERWPFPSPPEHLPPVYRSGLVPPSEGARVGLFLGEGLAGRPGWEEHLLGELAFLEEAGGASEGVPVWGRGLVEEPCALEHLVESAGRRGIRLQIEAVVPPLAPDAIERLARSGWRRVVLDLPASEGAANAGMEAVLATAAAAKDRGLALTLRAWLDALPVSEWLAVWARLEHHGLLDSVEIHYAAGAEGHVPPYRVLPAADELRGRGWPAWAQAPARDVASLDRALALTLAFLSGRLPDPARSVRLARTVKVEDVDVSWLTRLLGRDGRLLLEEPTSPRSPPVLRSPDGATLHRFSPALQGARSQALLAPLICLTEENGGIRLAVAEYFHPFPPRIRRRPLAARGEAVLRQPGATDPEAIYTAEVLEVEDEAALRELVSRLEEVETTGTLTWWPSQPLLADVCRWGRVPGCCATGLGRLWLERDGVRPCRHAPVLAPAGSGLPELRRRIAALQAEVEARRGCSSCPVRDRCARCPFLPSGIKPDAYCRVRRRFPWLGDALEALHAASVLAARDHSLLRVGRVPVRVAGLGGPLFYTGPAPPAAGAPVAAWTGAFTLVEIAGVPYLLRAREGLPQVLPRATAAVCEGIGYGIGRGQLAAWLAGEEGLGLDEARERVERAWSLVIGGTANQSHLTGDGWQWEGLFR